MLDPYIGEVILVAFNFAPRNWLACDGQLLPISSNTALFSILGTTYGGDGKTTFGLPDLRGRAPLHENPNHRLGSQGGAETVTLRMEEMAAHSHQFQANTGEAQTSTIANNLFAAAASRGIQIYKPSGGNPVNMAEHLIQETGSGQPHNNLQPYLAMNYILAIQGIYPPRDGGGSAGDEPFIGEVRAFAFGKVPRDWAACDGQLLPIANYQALFSLIGTTYGGDGRTTFALPDLRGRTAISQGKGPLTSNYTIGAKGGAENVQLTVGQIPSHDHQSNLETGAAATGDPNGNMLAADASTYSSATPGATFNGDAVTYTGGSAEHPNMMPFLTLNYCICLNGIFPSRS